MVFDYIAEKDIRYCVRLEQSAGSLKDEIGLFLEDYRLKGDDCDLVIVSHSSKDNSIKIMPNTGKIAVENVEKELTTSEFEEQGSAIVRIGTHKYTIYFEPVK